MVVFLTSSFIEFQTESDYTPKPLVNSNGFANNMRLYWKENANFLVFACDPDNTSDNDFVCRQMYDAFTLADFSINEISCFDRRSIAAATSPAEALTEALRWADVLFLAGGHAPTGNSFMTLCKLPELLHKPSLFDGIFIGLSAGSVNAASTVYLPPELEGESLDPDFTKSAQGLGLTDINIIPHSQMLFDFVLDGQNYYENVLIPDSSGRELYMLPDGSYLLIRKGVTQLFGLADILENGRLFPISSGIINTSFPKTGLNKYFFKALSRDYYELVFELDPDTGKIIFYYVSEFQQNHGIIPVNIDSYDMLIKLFSSTLVVAEEKECVLDQLRLPVILDEIKSYKNFVRTIHIDTEGGIQALSVRVNPIHDEKKRLLCCITNISMVLDRDWMTDVLSRDGFLSSLNSRLADSDFASGYSVVFANIPGFKAINEMLGLQNGDMTIFTERDALQEVLKPILLARLEGDHFALLTETSNLTEDNLDRLSKQYYQSDSKKMPFQIRCGIYHITDTGKSAQYMLDQAKLAENSISQDHGHSYAIFDDRLRMDYMLQRTFVSELDSAIENNEFVTYFQPIVDTYSEEIVSAEALIRWIHPERGMVSPGQFIPLFEKEGLITKLDSLMINNVLNFNQKRLAQGKRIVPCAVNLSRVDFYDTKLMSMLKTKLPQQKDVEKMLKFEVTESAYSILEADAIDFLEEMKRLKLSLLLDDFGSGMSSLSTLVSFGFDVIKLDMGFIAKIGQSEKAEAIIRHTIGLAHDLGAKTIAEGVEAREQLDFLRSAGCDMIQGFYFYKPLPGNLFEDLL